VARLYFVCRWPDKEIERPQFPGLRCFAVPFRCGFPVQAWLEPQRDVCRHSAPNRDLNGLELGRRDLYQLSLRPRLGLRSRPFLDNSAPTRGFANLDRARILPFYVSECRGGFCARFGALARSPRLRGPCRCVVIAARLFFHSLVISFSAIPLTCQFLTKSRPPRRGL
jgi:hypothetical protein